MFNGGQQQAEQAILSLLFIQKCLFPYFKNIEKDSKR